MSALQLPATYLYWHYTLAWSDLVRLYLNFAWFLWNFFSVSLLSRTLFSPWHRLKEAKSKDTAGFLGSFIINTILRFIGLFARLFTILTGLAALILFSVFFAAFLALWLIMPLLMVMLVANGVISLAHF